MLQLERLCDAFKRAALTRPTGYKRIAEGRFPTQIQLNERPARVPQHEVDQVLAAETAGASIEEVRRLVAQLKEARTIQGEEAA